MAPTEYSLAQAFKRIQEELIKSMIRNFEKHKAEELEEGFNWDQWQVVQLRELEKYRRQNLNKFDEEFDDIHSQLEELLRMADEDAQTNEEAKILDEILKGNFTRPDPGEIDLNMFGINERKLDSLIESTTNDLAKAERAVLRRSNDIYRQVIYDAQVYAANGGTYEQAIDMATKDFCKRGITSIVYKNGSRHTIEDYASMAIRTAHKRAYLLGEGKKHAEYGIHTVRVAKRQDACPLCLRWTGKVLIDDVYGGGTKEEARQKRLPLLSTAMAKGFLHPNCRDVYSLYIEGVSKPAEPWTEYELRVLADKYNQEEGVKHAQIMAGKWQFVADTRLDEQNKKEAEARVKEWQEKAKILSESNSLPSVSQRVYSEEELKEAFLRYSSGGENYIINEALRERRMKDLDKDQLEWIYALDEAIKQAPKYEGEVRRSINSVFIKDVDAFWKRYSEGNLVSEFAFTSTSTGIYDESFDIQMHILSKTGADFRDLNPDEQEILFGRKTKFRVTKVKDKEIWLEEV